MSEASSLDCFHLITKSELDMNHVFNRPLKAAEESLAAAESDPRLSPADSIDSHSDPDDGDAPAFGRAAVLAKAGPETGQSWDIPSMPNSPLSSRESSRAPTEKSYTVKPELDEGEARRQRFQDILRGSWKRSQSWGRYDDSAHQREGPNKYRNAEAQVGP